MASVHSMGNPPIITDKQVSSSLSPFHSIRGIRMSHLNICSLLPKCQDIYILLSLYDIDIMFLNETWLKSEISNRSLYLPGYHIIRLDRPTHGGGTMFAIKNQFTCHTENTLILPCLELLNISLILPSSLPITLISMYRPPSSNIYDFFENFTNFLSNIDYYSFPFIIVGDLNINILNLTCGIVKKFKHILSDYGLCINNSMPTRITTHSKSLIDLVISNKKAEHFINHISTIPCDFSDHHIISFGYKKPKPTKCKTTILFRDFSTCNLQSANTSLSSLLNDFTFSNNTDIDIVHIMQKINSIISGIPLKRIILKDNNHPWINDSYIKLCNYRKKLFQKARSSNNYRTLQLAKIMKNKCTSYARQLQSKYVHTSLQKAQNDPKKTWRLLKTYISDNDTPLPLKMSFSGNVLTDSTNIADSFNDFFISSINNLTLNFQNLPVSDTSYHPFFAEFYFQHTSVDHVIKLIAKIKKSCNSQFSVHPRFLYFCSDSIGKIICIFINNCFNVSEFPNCWKVANVIPKHKKGSQYDASNYRPISLLPNLCKIMEKIMCEQIHIFLSTHKLLYPSQHGFRPGFSTATCCTELLQHIFCAWDKGHYIAVVYLDFSKAFDIINHDILLKKLKALNFSQPSLNLIKSYLTNRKQTVSYAKSVSCTLNVNHGVPQGSVLGPLLFLLYINDLPHCITHAKTLIYADDTTLFVSHKNYDTLLQHIQEDINSLVHYCHANGLIINAAKTKIMFFGKKLDMPHTCPITISGENIDEIDCHKFLGIHIDNKLKFSSHIEHIIKKLNSVNFLLTKCRRFLPINSLCMIFNSVGLVHIHYCDVVFLPYCTSKLFKLMSSKYVEAGRIILNRKQGTSSSLVLSTLQWLPLSTHLLINQLAFIHSIVFHLKDSSISGYLLNFAHNHATRGKSTNFYLPHVSSERGKHMFSFWGPSLWRSVPQHIKIIPSKASFKTLTTKFIQSPS